MLLAPLLIQPSVPRFPKTARKDDGCGVCMVARVATLLMKHLQVPLLQTQPYAGKALGSHTVTPGTPHLAFSK